MTSSSKNLLKWILPALIALCLAPFTPKLDLACTEYFFKEGSFSSAKFFTFIYRYGVYPAFIASFAACGAFVASFFIPSLKKARLPLLFVTLAMLLGPGLLINVLFKGFFVRPRPLHVLQFGGTEFFKPFFHFSLAFPNAFKSFPSGHASMGFYFLTFLILGLRLKSPFWTRFGLVMTSVMGGALSLARIAQGKHFFSDTFMSLCFIWYVTLWSDWFVFDFLAKKNKLRYIKD